MRPSILLLSLMAAVAVISFLHPGARARIPEEWRPVFWILLLVIGSAALLYTEFKPIVCSRCGTKNRYDAERCSHCGQAFPRLR